MRRLGVVDQPRRIRPVLLEDVQDGTVHLEPAQRRERFPVRPPSQLVPESHGVAVEHQQAGSLAFGDRGVRVSRMGRHQPQLGARGDHRDELEHAPRRGAQSCGADQHGVADAGGRRAFTRRQRLGDQERVAAGRGEQRLRVGVRAGQLGHRGGRQRPQRDAHHVVRRDRGGDGSQPMVERELVVSERDQQDASEAADAPGHVRDHVERRLVRPMAVLDHAERLSIELLPQRSADRVQFAAVDRRHERVRALFRDLAQRRQRLGHGEVVARAPQEAQLAGCLLRESAGERRLSSAAGVGGLRGDVAAAGRALHGRLAAATKDPLERGHHLAHATETPDARVAGELDDAVSAALHRGLCRPRPISERTHGGSRPITTPPKLVVAPSRRRSAVTCSASPIARA